MPNTAALQHPPEGLANATNQPRPQLRRAVYIHVSDLTSAYNIDHARLEEELARVKKDRDDPAEPTTTRLGIPTELDTFSQKRLQPPRGGYNLCVLVGNVNVVVDKGRVDGSRVRLAEVEVGDETGTVSLRARDEQIDTLREVSERSGAVVLRNCTLELYQGKHIRLAITKWGKLSMYPDQVASTPAPPSKRNQERNFSLIDLSLVASEMATFPQTDQYGQPTGDTSSNAGNRTSSFQSGLGMPRRGGGGGGRRPAQRGGRQGGHNPNMQLHYGEPGMVPTMRYQGSMQQQQHPYGGGYGEAQPYSYPPQRQQDHSMMMHQQQQQQQHYEMQQRQLQHQMYHGGPPQDRQRPLHGSPMLVPTVSAAPSFDGSFGSGELPMPLLSNQFLMPIAGGQQQQQHPHSPPTLHSSRAESPMSPGKMNPQAATFDPRTSKPNEK